MTASTMNVNFVKQFHDTLHMLSEQTQSALQGIFPKEVGNGQIHFFDTLGSVNLTEITDESGQTPTVKVEHGRRAAAFRRAGIALDIPDVNKLQMMVDPTNSYTRRIVEAINRDKDKVILDALVGSALTGVAAGSSTALPSTSKVAHGSTALTVDKLIKAKKIMDRNRVDLRKKKYLIVDAYGMQGLLSDTKFTSFDYQPNRPIAENVNPSFRGIEIVQVELIDPITYVSLDSASNVYRAILCTEDALKVALYESMTVKTAELPDQNWTYRVGGYHSMAAVRMEEALVTEVAFQQA